MLSKVQYHVLWERRNISDRALMCKTKLSGATSDLLGVVAKEAAYRHRSNYDDDGNMEWRSAIARGEGWG